MRNSISLTGMAIITCSSVLVSEKLNITRTFFSFCIISVFSSASTIVICSLVNTTYLTQLIHHFDRTPHNLNCNIGTVILVTKKHFSNDYFSGYPFQAVSELPLAIPQGIAIRHKRTGEV